jgi:hypothetical protein
MHKNLSLRALESLSSRTAEWMSGPMARRSCQGAPRRVRRAKKRRGARGKAHCLLRLCTRIRSAPLPLFLPR